MDQKLKSVLRMLLRGQLIVSGGGVSITQLTTGQIQISISPADAANNNSRARSGSSGSGGQGGPGEPDNPYDPPDIPDIPPLPPGPDDGSGEYGGPTKKGRKIKGATSDDTGSGLDYDFNQQGINYYLNQF